MPRPGRTARLVRAAATAAIAAVLLSGCVYDVSDYGLETPEPTGSSDPVPTADPDADASAAPAERIDLPEGCAPASLAVDWAEPVAGAADELLAVRVMVVRVPSAGEESGYGSTPQSVTRTDTELHPQLTLTPDVPADGSPETVDALTPVDRWASLLSEDLRGRGLVDRSFGAPLQLTSFDPVLDRAARYVIGYLGSPQSARFTITGCAGAFRSTGVLDGVDPRRSAGAVLLECGVEPGDQYDRWDLLQPYCAGS